MLNMKCYVIVVNEISYGCFQEVIILRICRELPNVDVFIYHITSRVFMNISELCDDSVRMCRIKHIGFISFSSRHASVSSGGSRIFPRGGREPSRGGVNTPNFPENCMKSKEFGRPGGGVRPSRPP